MKWRIASQAGENAEMEYSDVPGDLQLALCLVALFLVQARAEGYEVMTVPDAFEWFVWHPQVEVTLRIALQLTAD